jgi:hypothetical protein
MILAAADEFVAELDGDGIVHILDGEGVIRLSMDYDIWERFTANALAKRAIT